MYLICNGLYRSRNDLYLTLERGEFERGGKSTPKNIEVTVSVVHTDGRIVEVSSGHWTRHTSGVTSLVLFGVMVPPAPSAFSAIYYSNALMHWLRGCLHGSGRCSTFIIQHMLRSYKV